MCVSNCVCVCVHMFMYESTDACVWRDSAYVGAILHTNIVSILFLIANRSEGFLHKMCAIVNFDF